MQPIEYKLKLLHSKMLTPSVLGLTFARSDGLPCLFKAGQFITFLLPHHTGKLIRRSYSLASSPAQPYELEMAISPVYEGFATEVLFNLKVGDELLCVGPSGRLVLQDDELPTHYLLVATATGVAPYRAMLDALATRLERDSDLKVTLLLGVRSVEELLYLEDFIAFEKAYRHFHFRAYLSRATACNTVAYIYSGYVQSAFESLALNPATDIAYLCGNPDMVHASIDKLRSMGFHSKHIRFEKYVSVRVKP